MGGAKGMEGRGVTGSQESQGGNRVTGRCKYSQHKNKNALHVAKTTMSDPNNAYENWFYYSESVVTMY